VFVEIWLADIVGGNSSRVRVALSFHGTKEPRFKFWFDIGGSTGLGLAHSSSSCRRSISGPGGGLPLLTRVLLWALDKMMPDTIWNLHFYGLFCFLQRLR
jgi:hypothetical protein